LLCSFNLTDITLVKLTKPPTTAGRLQGSDEVKLAYALMLARPLPAMTRPKKYVNFI
jgi:hypothetical protein